MVLNKLRGKTQDHGSDHKSGPVVYTPFDHPSGALKVPAEAKLSDTQLDKYQQVYAHFALADIKVALLEETHKHKDPSHMLPLTDAEKAWLTRECFLRYLRATKWVVADAIDRIELTLAWRREFGVAG